MGLIKAVSGKGMKKRLVCMLLLFVVILSGCSSGGINIPFLGGGTDNGLSSDNVENIAAMAGDEMSYSTLGEKDKDTKTAMSVVNGFLNANRKAHQTQTGYPRFRVGNMAFVEIRTVPNVDVRDLDIPSEYVVVVLGDNPQLSRTPNRELFANFMKVIRADPDIMTLNQRVRTALVLATGDDSYIGAEGYEPTWTDEDGILVISYYRYTGSRMMVQEKTAFTLTVDENQDYVICKVSDLFSEPQVYVDFLLEKIPKVRDMVNRGMSVYIEDDPIMIDGDVHIGITLGTYHEEDDHFARELFYAVSADWEIYEYDAERDVWWSQGNIMTIPGANIANNGGNFVKYRGDIYYRQYEPGSFEESGLWDGFAPRFGAQASVMRLGWDGSQEVVWSGDGFGPIFIFHDNGLEPMLILTRLTRDGLGVTHTETFGVTIYDHEVMFKCFGTLFAVDEERELVIMSSANGLLFTGHLKSLDQNDLSNQYRDPLYYDQSEGVLYCSVSDWSSNTTMFTAIDVVTCKETVLLSDTNDSIGENILEIDYAQFIEFSNVEPKGDYVYANVAAYSGNGYMYGASARLSFHKSGGSYTNLGPASETDWFGANKPFTYRSDGPHYIDLPGYYMFGGTSGADAVMILSSNELSELGLPDGEYFGEDDFVVLQGVEYVDGDVFFTVVVGSRNYSEDIGWRYGYDREWSTVYRKDLATGAILEVYSY